MDWFRFVMEAGKSYRIDLLGADTGDGTQQDPYLTGLLAVFDESRASTTTNYGYQPDGLNDGNGEMAKLVWYDWDDGEAHVGNSNYNDDGGIGYNARLYLRNFPPGVYYVMAAGWQSIGTYRMTLTEVIGDGDAIGAVSVDGNVVGEIDFRDDTDSFDVSLTANTDYLIHVDPFGPWNNRPKIGSIVYQGVPTTTSFNSDFTKFTATETGDYRITVYGDMGAGGEYPRSFGEGEYALSVRSRDPSTLDGTGGLRLSGDVSPIFPETARTPVEQYNVTGATSSIRWFLSGDDAQHFYMRPHNLLHFSFGDPPDHEAPVDADGDNVYEVALRAMQFDESVGTFVHSVSMNVEVTVTNVAD